MSKTYTIVVKSAEELAALNTETVASDWRKWAGVEFRGFVKIESGFYKDDYQGNAYGEETIFLADELAEVREE